MEELIELAGKAFANQTITTEFGEDGKRKVVFAKDDVLQAHSDYLAYIHEQTDDNYKKMIVSFTECKNNARTGFEVLCAWLENNTAPHTIINTQNNTEVNGGPSNRPGQ